MGASTKTELILHARKRHQCSWCGEFIELHQSYGRYRWFDGNDASTVKMHPECLGASRELAAETNGEIEFSPGDHPRGCYCEHDKDCEHCISVLAGSIYTPYLQKKSPSKEGQ